VLFVRPGGTGTSGTSNAWATAFGSLQAALNAANTATGQKQIWMAGGTNTATNGILLKSNISIYGVWSPIKVIAPNNYVFSFPN
jgi:hypothetical protein